MEKTHDTLLREDEHSEPGNLQKEALMFGSKTDFSAPENPPLMNGSEVNAAPNCYSIPAETPAQSAPLGHEPISNPGPAGGDTLGQRE